MMPDIEWKMFFDGWAPIVRTLILGTLGYFGLVILLRISGKRTLSKMNAFDFVVTVAFGSALAAMLTSQQVSLAQGLTALALLVFMQLLITFASVRSQSLRRLIKAQPTLVFFKGQFLVDAMRKQRVTEDDILAAIRQQNGGHPEEVDAVILETEGSLSVIKSQIHSVDLLSHLGVEIGKQAHNRLQVERQDQ